jgi:hypothetical protein
VFLGTFLVLLKTRYYTKFSRPIVSPSRFRVIRGPLTVIIIKFSVSYWILKIQASCVHQGHFKGIKYSKDMRARVSLTPSSCASPAARAQTIRCLHTCEVSSRDAFTLSVRPAGALSNCTGPQR